MENVPVDFLVRDEEDRSHDLWQCFGSLKATFNLWIHKSRAAWAIATGSGRYGESWEDLWLSIDSHRTALKDEKDESVNLRCLDDLRLWRTYLSFVNAGRPSRSQPNDLRSG